MSPDCAFLEFRDAAREHLGLDVTGWRPGEDPPDYYLRIGTREVAVEVTRVQACKDAFEANAAVAKVLSFLRDKTQSLPTGEAVEVLFDPTDAVSIPIPRRCRNEYALLLRYLGAFPAMRIDQGGMGFCRADFYVTRQSYRPPGIHVMPQACYAKADEQAWGPAVNEAIRAKIAGYGGRLCTSCWLLVDLRAYIRGTNEALHFLTHGVEIENLERVSGSFQRVYALTGYIPDTGRGPTCPVRRLLPPE
jgi:hypothetical protein